VTERPILWPKLFLTAALGLALSFSLPHAQAHGGGGGGGHCGGGAHFGGGHGGGGGHCGGGAHFGGGAHCSAFSGHSSGCHISSGHITSNSRTHGGNMNGHASSIFDARANHITSGHRILQLPSERLSLQEMVSSGSAPNYCSSIVRPEHHAGLLGHIHKFFANKPCDLQNIHTELVPRALTEIACEPTIKNALTHQMFIKANATLNELTARATYLRAEAQKYRCLDQTNRNVIAWPFANDALIVNIDNRSYPAAELDEVLQREGSTGSTGSKDVELELVQTNPPQTFSGVSYMLPNPGGILNTYFSYENTINNFLLLHKGSFLAVTLSQTP
jgi:hypothetical protein